MRPATIESRASKAATGFEQHRTPAREGLIEHRRLAFAADLALDAPIPKCTKVRALSVDLALGAPIPKCKKTRALSAVPGVFVPPLDEPEGACSAEAGAPAVTPSGRLSKNYFFLRRAFFLAFFAGAFFFAVLRRLATFFAAFFLVVFLFFAAI